MAAGTNNRGRPSAKIIGEVISRLTSRCGVPASPTRPAAADAADSNAESVQTSARRTNRQVAKQPNNNLVRSTTDAATQAMARATASTSLGSAGRNIQRPFTALPGIGGAIAVEAATSG